jgi:hypothetical protein
VSDQITALLIELGYHPQRLLSLDQGEAAGVLQMDREALQVATGGFWDKAIAQGCVVMSPEPEPEDDEAEDDED